MRARLAETSGLPTTFGTVHGAGAIENVRETSGAASWFPSPVCDAVIVHEPARVRCTLAPVTVHVPRAAKETGRPEDAVAWTVKSGSPKAFSPSAANAIVWSASGISARLWNRPAAIAPTPERPAGTLHWPPSFVPLPHPQTMTVPSLRSATLW